MPLKWANKREDCNHSHQETCRRQWCEVMGVLINLENSFTRYTYVKPSYILMLFVNDFLIKPRKSRPWRWMGKQGGRDTAPWSLQLKCQQSDLTQKVSEAHMRHVRPMYEHTIFSNWHASNQLARQPDTEMGDKRDSFVPTNCLSVNCFPLFVFSHCRNTTVKTGGKWF